jgi:cytochrome P450
VESYLDYVDADPYSFYGRKLAAGPVHWDEGMRAWLVFGYEEARFVSTKPDLFEHPYNDFRGAKEVQGGTRGILMLHGDEHQRMHNFLLSHFSPSVVRRYREQLIRPLVQRRLDEIAERDRADLSDDFAAKIPSDVIAALLGLDWHDEELLANCREWNHSIFRWSETFGEDEGALQEALSAALELEAVLMPVIRARQQVPTDDIISLLWKHGPEILQPWTEAEVLAQCRVLFFAGSDTTAHFLRNAMYVLMTEPHWQDELRGDDQRIENFVDEVLRFYSPVHFRVRVARQDVEVGGQLVKKGDRLHPMNAAANRDPRHYANPNEVQIDRQPLRDHLAFHIGPRFCVGAALARGEGVEAIHALLERVQSLALDPDADPPRFLGHMPRSHRPLNSLLTARKPAVR